jgi:hypothetical protein
MNLPTKPTSKAWNLDARALLDMGATSIDAATVRGTVAELDKLRNAIKNKLQEIYQNTCITEADEELQRALYEVDGKDDDK